MHTCLHTIEIALMYTQFGFLPMLQNSCFTLNFSLCDLQEKPGVLMDKSMCSISHFATISLLYGCVAEHSLLNQNFKTQAVECKVYRIILCICWHLSCSNSCTERHHYVAIPLQSIIIMQQFLYRISLLHSNSSTEFHHYVVIPVHNVIIISNSSAEYHHYITIPLQNFIIMQ